ncbi:MAG: signal peptidase I [Limisphaerales bacterium]
MDEPSPPTNRLWGALRHGLRWGEHLLAVIGAVLIAYHLCFELSVMVSPSMSPTLQGTKRENGDWVLTEKITYWFREPRRWEVVRFNLDDYTPVMKRVVALPKETITIKTNNITINGESVLRPDSITNLTYYSYGNLSSGRPVPCDWGYYVLGDDSRDSQDSRFEGAIKPDKIQGRVLLRVWPLNRFGWVR